jgi:hypothetical protein
MIGDLFLKNHRFAVGIRDITDTGKDNGLALRPTGSTQAEKSQKKKCAFE